ncbi:hypothetical protein [Burkholderia sp. WSM2232]|uniref:hypothetical protein n=1 Tax=Burkholderia sp. WSM2232 TaxID=944436 RepID=UPI0005514DE4|nr:hypothetical protein [Burkholderia sp. WSM2232]
MGFLKLSSAAAFDKTTGEPYIFMQYFPVFSQNGTRKNVDVDPLWDRVEDELRARSLLWSTGILVVEQNQTVTVATINLSQRAVHPVNRPGLCGGSNF